jgi:polyisoprenoid-binding protein YceI
MKKITVLVFTLFSAGITLAQTWSLDKAHAKLEFGVTHLLVSDVEGNFKALDAKITSSSSEDFVNAVIELTAETASIDTDNEQRDQHLKGPDFFDAAKYTSLTFKSKSFTKISDRRYKMVGDLTLHGITKTVELEATFNGTAIHPYTQKTIVGFKVVGSLKRSDFDIGKGTPGAIVSDEVTINANVEFIKD